MWGDEVLEFVRAAREAHAARYGYDMEAMIADLRRREGSSGHPVLMPPEPVVGDISAATSQSPQQTPDKVAASKV